MAQLDEKLSLIDSADLAIKNGLLRAARFRQSILQQAFEGNLVPQDPHDEPASVLLGRIKAGLTQSRTVKTRHKRTTTLKNSS